MKLPFEINLKNKVVVITGAGGVICSHLAKAVADRKSVGRERVC